MIHIFMKSNFQIAAGDLKLSKDVFVLSIFPISLIVIQKWSIRTINAIYDQTCSQKYPQTNVSADYLKLTTVIHVWLGILGRNFNYINDFRLLQWKQVLAVSITGFIQFTVIVYLIHLTIPWLNAWSPCKLLGKLATLIANVSYGITTTTI